MYLDKYRFIRECKSLNSQWVCRKACKDLTFVLYCWHKVPNDNPVLKDAWHTQTVRLCSGMLFSGHPPTHSVINVYLFDFGSFAAG